MRAADLLDELAEAGVTVKAEGGSLVIRPASKLTERQRLALREAKPQLLTLFGHVVGPGRQSDAPPQCVPNAERRRYLDRHARLLRWGWPEPDAVRLAQRLAQRDLEQDDRVSCADCRFARPGRCVNHRRAGLAWPEIGPDLVALPQRCPGFQPVFPQPAA